MKWIDILLLALLALSLGHVACKDRLAVLAPPAAVAGDALPVQPQPAKRATS